MGKKIGWGGGDGECTDANPKSLTVGKSTLAWGCTW